MVRRHEQSWRTAISATLHCLTGCAIGEVLGMVLATWWGWGDVASIVLAVVLAFFFGYLLTFTGVRRAGLDVRTAVRTALAADTVSILVMEIVDNAILLVVPGAMAAGLTTGLFWGALAVALAVAFVVTVPGQQVDDRSRQGPRGRPRDAPRRPPLTGAPVPVRGRAVCEDRPMSYALGEGSGPLRGVRVVEIAGIGPGPARLHAAGRPRRRRDPRSSGRAAGC